MSSEDYSVNLPKAVDYTSRDFESIKQDLIERIRYTGRIPEWIGNDPSDFGIVLLESFAYLGDLMSFYIDRAANETSITTAVRPSSVYSLAQSYGYTPVGYRQATVTVTVTNDTNENITFPQDTVFAGEVLISDTVIPVYFTSIAEITIEANSTAVVDATHGKSVTLFPITTQNPEIDNETYGELLAISTAEPNMTFKLTEGPVADGTVEVFVQDDNAYTQWTRVNYLMDYGPTDLVFTTFFTSNNEYYVQFGDGVSGAIPAGDALIQARYVVGGGKIGNIPIQTINEITYIPNFIGPPEFADVTVTNVSEGSGGYDPEPLEVIRTLAPLTIRANNRAVTLQDFESLALSVNNVGKAKAIGTSPTAVTLYVAPVRSWSDGDLTPGLYFDGVNYQPTQELISLKEAVNSFIEDKMLLGTSLTLANPTYVDVELVISYKKLDQYAAEDLEAKIKKTVIIDYSYEFVDFNSTVYPQDIELSIQAIAGIRYVKVTEMYKSGDPSSLGAVTSNPDEILRFTSANIVLVEDEG